MNSYRLTGLISAFALCLSLGCAKEDPGDGGSYQALLASSNASRVEIEPNSTFLADGESEATVRVTLLSEDAVPVSGPIVRIEVSGSENVISAETSSDSNGVAIGTIRSTFAETKTVSVLVNPGPLQILLEQKPVVTFLPVPHSLKIVKQNGGIEWLDSASIKDADTGDFDGDGKDELAIATDRIDGDKFYILKVQADYSYRLMNLEERGQNYSSGIWGITMGDLDGDGKDEFSVARMATPWYPIFKYSGEGKIVQIAEGTTVGYHVRGVQFGDYNGDGKDDLMVSRADYNTENCGICIYNGDTQVTSRHGASQMSLGDTDGDKRQEIAAAWSTLGWLKIYRHNPETNAFDEMTHNLLLSPGEINTGFGDLDGDGKDEVGIAHVPDADGNTLHVLKNDPNGNGFTVLYSGGSEWSSANPGFVRFGDLDGDGKDEMAVAFKSESVNTSRFITLKWVTDRFELFGNHDTGKSFSEGVESRVLAFGNFLSQAHQSLFFSIDNASPTSGHWGLIDWSRD